MENVVFAALVYYGLRYNPTRIIVSDFNQDGKQEIMVNFYSTSKFEFAILLGNSDGAFYIAMLA